MAANPGSSTIGAGKGNPLNNPHALGAQDEGDPFDVGKMTIKHDKEYANVVQFKQFYTNVHKSIVVGDDGGSAQFVFPTNTGSSAADYQDVVKPYFTVKLNSVVGLIGGLGNQPSGISSTWKSPNAAAVYVPIKWNEYANRFRHYKVLKTKIVMKIEHTGCVNKTSTGMPFRIFGWRGNTHNKAATINNLPTNYGQIYESPEGFQVCDYLYPSIIIRDPDSVNQPREFETIYEPVDNRKISHTFTYTYDPSDVTTEVDLDGDMNNKSMWSAVDGEPPEDQVLHLFVNPKYVRYGTGSNSAYRFINATARVDIMVYQTVQFRDPKIDTSFNTPSTISIINPI